MKRLIVPFLAVATLLFLGPMAYAQHGGRPSGTPGSMGGSASGTHGDSASHGEIHGSSDATTSPSLPGTVLSRNPKLEPALTKALGKSGITLPSGMTLSQVCTTNGFRTLGQCIAALHINHKFPSCTLADLSGAKSLGKAIQGCDSSADAKTEAHSAVKQANQEIKESGS
jgi:hypothetical protein